MRWIKHLFIDDFLTNRAFPRKTLSAIEKCIASQEKRHRGELRFVVEGGLPVGPYFSGQTAHERALEIFSLHRVWDTEDNAGVLIYLMLADQRVELVADRGIDAKVGDAAWDAICRGMQSEFAAGRFEAGALLGIEAISDLLAVHFPPGHGIDINELPDAPVLL